MNKKSLPVIIVFVFVNTLLYSQAATNVIDDKHNETTAVELSTKTTASILKGAIENPFFEKISKVQTFLKDAARIVSSVVANLKMTRQVIEEEEKIYELFVHCRTRLQEADNFPDKWKYNKVLLELLRESIRVYEVFDLATQQNMGIIDDRGRIELIKQVLLKTRKIRRSMYIALRRANRSILKYKRVKREIKTFKRIFKKL